MYTPLDFAQAFLGEYKIKASELSPRYCPFCNGGKHKDKYTFALNIDAKVYKCLRGSCGAQGHFSELCKIFGVEMHREDDFSMPTRAVYQKPAQQPKTAGDSIKSYLKLRGICEQTLGAYRVGADDSGNIMFPHYDEKGEHVFNKYRPAKKIAKGERKAWRDKGTMPVLYGMWRCEYDKPLVITEGEIDALSCHEAGVPNAVSVPSGTEDFTWLDTCWDFIQQFEDIYIFGDNDTAGQEMIKKLCIKLSDKRLYVVEHEYKDANELLYRRGAASVKNVYDNAKVLPIVGLINLAEVTPLDPTTLKSTGTSIKRLDSQLGGFIHGDVTVWTGREGEGKSTLLSMIMLDAIQEGEKVCAYSGELRADRFQYWTDLQAAGASNIKTVFSKKRNRDIQIVENSTKERIHSWYNEKYWLYDNSAATEDESITILKIFELAAKRHDCKIFLVDNLMTADHGIVSEADYYRRQSMFVGQLVSFAQRHNAHVHLVAHPKKQQQGKRQALTNEDVLGSGEIVKRAANVIAVERKERDKDGCDLTVSINKNRWEGKKGMLKLNYCHLSHRIYDSMLGDVTRYSWESASTQEILGDFADDLPF